MSKYIKPNMEGRWAQAGNIASPTSEKIEEGWVEEIPPSELANFVENRQDEAIAYILQQGIAEWDTTTEYQPSSVIQHAGKVYRSQGVNVAQQPDITASWEEAFDEYGSSQAVQQALDDLVAAPDPLTQYALKNDGTSTGTHTFENTQATSYNVAQGTPEVGVPKGYSFGSLKTTGFYQDVTSGKVVYRHAGVVTGEMPSTATISSSANDKTLVSAEWVKSWIAQAIYPVGGLYTTTVNTDPSVLLGFGTWQRYAEGKALVGYSSDVTAATPDWLKIVGNVFGNYQETLNTTQIPSHYHTTVGDDELRVGSRFGSDGLTPETDTLYPYDSVSNASPAAGRQYRTSATGGGLPHNNVQPSIIVFVWRRVT